MILPIFIDTKIQQLTCTICKMGYSCILSLHLEVSRYWGIKDILKRNSLAWIYSVNLFVNNKRKPPDSHGCRAVQL